MEAAALSTVLCVLALVVADADHHVVHVQGRRHPILFAAEARRCGVRSYELDCSSDDGKASIPINTGTYYTILNLLVDGHDSCGRRDSILPVLYTNATYADFVKSVRGGFVISYRWRTLTTWYGLIKDCLNESVSLGGSDNNPLPRVGIKDQIIDILSIVLHFWGCMIGISRGYYLNMRLSISDMIRGVDHSLYHKLFILHTLCLVKWIAGNFQFFSLASFTVNILLFVFAPLVVMIFLTHKYWKTRIAIDAGVLLPGDVHVAIKMLDGNSNCNGEDFISEVATIGRIHHINVVRLVGFCSEETRRVLVYEYRPRGSLNKYIFSSEGSFSWDKLNEIALGIARGINYLHQGCEMQILHFDIKPDNILLDDNFVPKVADFGLAKLYPRDKSFVSDRALRGTVGYIAPEMVSRSFGTISGKSDVYSFGMLLLEMAGGRRNADPDADSSASKAYYPSWVYDQIIADQQVDEISNVSNMHELERKLCLVGLWCIQMKLHDRPTMSEVIEMLEGDVSVMGVPPRPFFCDGDGIGNGIDSYFHSSELTAISEEDDGIAELASG
uniref:Protein kinase domain-containing protein n=1 Tax=Oryza nivara TaxID=4536 RepID=A0A0E0GY12_ORYNI